MRVLKALILPLPALVWGGFLWWYAIRDQDWPLAAAGAPLIALGLGSFIYHMMKAFAPPSRDEIATQTDAVTFDTDAALSNYLAAKSRTFGAEPTLVSPRASEPVFGRKR
jgi:hypothetical protein